MGVLLLSEIEDKMAVICWNCTKNTICKAKKLALL